MKEKFEPIFIEGQMIDLDNISDEKLLDLLSKLQDRQNDIREKVDTVLASGDKDALVGLLEDLKNVQKTLSILKYINFDKQTTAKVKQKVMQKKEFVDTEAERFGVDSEMATPSLNEYGEALEAVRGEYENEFKVLLSALGNGQEHEVAEVIAAQRKKDGDEELSDDSISFESRVATIESLRETISKIEEYINGSISRCNDKIDEITEENSLVETTPKKGIFSNFFGKITDKIGGKTKFTKNVIEPLDNKTNGIKKLLPIIKDIIRDQVVSKLIEICASEKGAIIRNTIAQKVTAMLPMLSEAAVTVGSIITSTAGIQALAIAGLATGAIVATKAIVDKVKENKEKKEQENNGLEAPDSMDGEEQSLG